MKLSCVVCEHNQAQTKLIWEIPLNKLNENVSYNHVPSPNTCMETKLTLPWALYILCLSTVTMNEASDHERSSNQNNFRNTSQQYEWQWQPFTPPFNTLLTLTLYYIDLVLWVLLLCAFLKLLDLGLESRHLLLTVGLKVLLLFLQVLVHSHQRAQIL